MVVADKAYASAERSAWLARRGIHNGILRRATRGHPLGEQGEWMNRPFRLQVLCELTDRSQFESQNAK
jgi:IS5 family transposase